MHFDWQTIVTAIGGAVLGIGAVVKFFGKWIPVTQKYVGISKDALDLVDSVIDSVEEDKGPDGKPNGKITITQEELDRIKICAIKLKEDFKK